MACYNEAEGIEHNYVRAHSNKFTNLPYLAVYSDGQYTNTD